MKTLTSMFCMIVCVNADVAIKEQSYINELTRPMRATLRYTTPKGIGYKTGYTTLEGFFSNLFAETYLPFLDLRGHVFDNGRWAANGGIGFRYVGWNRVWGVNSYYDYRDTSYQNYNQLSFGLETLGTFWDVRLNGYFPLGHKSSSLRDPVFNDFSGNYMYVRTKRSFALGGTNLEVGIHVDQFKEVPMYFTAGPYYLTGKGKSTWGGQLRASIDLFQDYLKIEGNVSYDHLFKWIGQGQISANVRFGKTPPPRTSYCSSTQPAPKAKKISWRRLRKSAKENESLVPDPQQWKETLLYARLQQPVDRSEIIPVSTQYIRQQAFDPTTNDPYHFVFVNNTSSSLGTYESPYGTLLAAQINSGDGDIIYLFPGDGTSNNMNAGITLQNSQMLLGSGQGYTLPTTLGSIYLPPLSTTMPVLTNSATSPVITLSNNNVVSGIYINNTTSNGIYGAGITNFTANGNSIVGGNTPTGTGEAILLNNVSGAIAVNNNFISQFAPQTATSGGYAVHIVQTNSACDATFTNNTILCQYEANPMNGIFADLSGTGSIGTLNITKGTFINSSGNGTAIQANLAGSSFISNVTVQNTNLSYWYNGLEFVLPGSGSIGTVKVVNSTIDSSAYAGLYLNLTGSGSINNVTVANSQIVQSTTYGIALSTAGSSMIGNVSVMGTALNNNGYGLYAIVDIASSISNVTISDSNLDYATSNGGAGIYITLPYGSTSSVDNITVSNSSLSYSSTGIYTANSGTGTITNLTTSGCTFINNSVYGIKFSPGSSLPLQNVLISNCIFSGSEYSIDSDGSGYITNFNVTGSTFTSNQYPFYLDCNVTNFNMINNIFNGNEEVLINLYSFQNSTINNNQFNGGSYDGLVIQTDGTGSLSILNNTFTGTSSATQGYAVSLTPQSGTVCVDFVGNVATPTVSGSNAPYYFNATGGTLNLTAESTQANNVGTITTIGTIGSCTQ